MSRDRAAPAAEGYLQQVADLLFDQLVDVIRVHQPETEPGLRGEAVEVGASPGLLARTIQAQGMWFQLLSIAEQNAAMRQRRQSEVERGHDRLRGTFAQVVGSAAEVGIPVEEVRGVVSSLRVRPVITAHPTEAKRVTEIGRAHV